MTWIGFILFFAGFVIFTATIRVQAFKSSIREGIFTFVIPFYGWWYGFIKLRKLPIMFIVLACYLIGFPLFSVGYLKNVIRKAKVQEAYATLDIMRKECANFFGMERVARGMDPISLPYAFPGVDFESPDAKSKDKVWEYTTHSSGVPKGERVMPDADWDEAVWREMRFSIEDPCYYRYTYRTGGVDKDAWFEIVAEGDLDGDGKTSSISRKCEIEEKTLNVTCSRRTYIVDEFE